MKILARSLVLMLAALSAEQGFAQTPAAPSPTATVVSLTAPEPVPYAWPSPTKTSPYAILGLPSTCAPEACAPHEDNNGNLLKGDPLLDGSCWASGLGWFGALEVDAVGPGVKQTLNAPLNIGRGTTLSMPTAGLDWTAMPRVDLGYRLGQGAGEFVLSYRGLVSAGSSSLANFDGAGNTAPLRSHLDMNVIDIDYASRENSLGPLWDMKWRTGARIATIFFDSAASTALISQYQSNNFVGGGVHFGVNLKRRLGDTGFSLIGELDGGVVLGHIHQLYAESINGAGTASATAQANEPAPVLEVRFGVDYAPQALPNLHLSTGYIFERWWAVGETLGTLGEVTFQGVFCRGEWRF